MSSTGFRERQRQVREDAILDAAYELLLEQGYAEMSMDVLAARLGVSKATLYQHFPSKDELVINVIIRGMRRGEEQMAALDLSQPALVRLERTIRHALENRVTMSAMRFMLPPGLTQDHAGYAAQKERMTAAISRLVDEAKADGDIRPELPTPLVVLLLGGVVREASYGDMVDLETFPPRELSGTLLGMMLDGIRASNIEQ